MSVKEKNQKQRACLVGPLWGAGWRRREGRIRASSSSSSAAAEALGLSSSLSLQSSSLPFFPFFPLPLSFFLAGCWAPPPGLPEASDASDGSTEPSGADCAAKTLSSSCRRRERGG